MPLDAKCLGEVVKELNSRLVGAKIDKIHQPNRDEIVMAVRSGGDNLKLFLSGNPNSPRMHFTNVVRENPTTPPMFCMLMRKHLTSGRILSISQVPSERIVRMEMEALNEFGDRVKRELVVEMMGRKANLILLDEEGRIIDCVRRVGGDLTAQRQILPGMFYRLPEGKLGLSPLINRELDFRELSDEVIDLLIEKEGQPTVLVKGGKEMDFTFIPILQYGPEVESKAYASFSELLDDYYANRETSQKGNQKSAELTKGVQRAMERVSRRIAQQQQELEATKDRERNRELGDILTSNIYSMRKGMDKVVCADFYHPESAEVEILIDPLLSPQENAAKYYKAYNKAKTAESILTVQILKGKGEAEYLEGVLESISLAEGERDLQEIRVELSQSGFLRSVGKQLLKQKIATKPMEFRTSSGMRVSVGKNNTQNDKLTTKLADKDDLWFHAQHIHGSHVILWTEGKEPDDLSFTQAAQLAAWFSQAREGKQVPVDYTYVRNIKKPAGARLGMVTFKTHYTAFVDPDKDLAKNLRVK